MIGLFDNRRMARRCAVLLAGIAVLLLMTDERYASLLLAETECISTLMQKTGAEFLHDLYSLVSYQYKACKYSHADTDHPQTHFLYWPTLNVYSRKR
jgi:hypothetical protein